MRNSPQRALSISATGRSIAILDQTLLPHAVRSIELDCAESVAEAIRTMRVRGAPLIGACAAFGLALALCRDASDSGLANALDFLAATRPTAVNLRWALERVANAVQKRPVSERAEAAWDEACRIAEEDAAINAAIGEHGLQRLQTLWQGKQARPGTAATVLQLMTHCNAGWLATVDWGTALAPIYKAHASGLPVHVWVSETRPRNQGALTAWELSQRGVPHTLIADNAAGWLMREGRVDAVIVGADRVTANGDVANKVGTYLKALAARANGIPFWVALPSPTFDASLASGAEIPIEMRAEEEVLQLKGRGAEAVNLFAPDCHALNPAFDVTPAELVSSYLTERGWFDSSEALLKGLQ